MTATAAADDLGSAHGELHQVGERDPAGDTPEQAGHQAEVRLPPRPTRARVHDVTVLSAIAAIQIAWVTALVYVVFWLLA